MNKLDCTIFELVNMLVITEGTLKSSRGTGLTMEWTSLTKRKSGWKKKNKSAKKQRKKSKPKKIFQRKLKQRKSVSTMMLKATGRGTVHSIWRA